MELTRANGKGWILSGAINGDMADWFERWFETDEKAIAYARKRGWSVVVPS